MVDLNSEDEDVPSELKKPESDEIKKGRQELDELKKYYTFGIDKIFNIPVENIHPAPAKMCYRKLNKDHVEEIAKSMVKVEGVEPHVADLVPYNLETQMLVHLERTLSDLSLLERSLASKMIHFVAISGQHLASSPYNLDSPKVAMRKRVGLQLVPRLLKQP